MCIYIFHELFSFALYYQDVTNSIICILGGSPLSLFNIYISRILSSKFHELHHSHSWRHPFLPQHHLHFTNSLILPFKLHEPYYVYFTNPIICICTAFSFSHSINAHSTNSFIYISRTPSYMHLSCSEHYNLNSRINIIYIPRTPSPMRLWHPLFSAIYQCPFHELYHLNSTNSIICVCTASHLSHSIIYTSHVYTCRWCVFCFTCSRSHEYTCIYIYACIYVYEIYVYMYMSIHVYICRWCVFLVSRLDDCVCIDVYICIYKYICICVYMYMSIHVYTCRWCVFLVSRVDDRICTDVYVCIHKYICICVYMYMSIYVYTCRWCVFRFTSR